MSEFVGHSWPPGRTMDTRTELTKAGEVKYSSRLHYLTRREEEEQPEAPERETRHQTFHI